MSVAMEPIAQALTLLALPLPDIDAVIGDFAISMTHRRDADTGV